MLRYLLTLLLVVPGLAGTIPVHAQAAPCQFQLGFKALHDLDPDDIGDCIDDEAHNPDNGDALQHTTAGLMVWRKADNWTAFTNGYSTWINGPNGLVKRLNTERFSWEANPQGLPIVAAPGQSGATNPDYLSWANPGPYRQPGWTDFHLHSFAGTQGIVFAYFFNFYRYATYQSDVQAKGGDFFPLHPTDLTQTDFASQAWYEKQFADMVDAGIDVVLYNYWGEPGQYAQRVVPAPERNLFSTQGIPPMVAALQTTTARGTPLRVGLFLDTTIMNNEDLTTERGKQVFYASIRDYFSRIPPALWAAIDSRPVIWLYDAQRVAAFDQSTFDYVDDHFAQDFGGLRPYIVREAQWYTAKNTTTSDVLRTEGVFGWGAAPFGFNPDPRFTVAEVGPGFNNALFTNRFHGQSGGVMTDRRGGQYYSENLERALGSGRRLLALETWNELCEGSGIQETVEYGRQYIAITRRYADRLKAIYPASLLPSAKF
jgi:hypothetical protein